MKTIFLFAFALLTAEIPSLPDEFYIEERFLSLTSTFDIQTANKSIATAKKRILSFTTAFDLEDEYQIPIASAESSFFAWGTMADIFDPQQRKIGWIEEEIFRIIPWSEYRIFNASDQLIMVAKMNFLGTQFVVSHPEDPNLIYATMTRSFFRIYRDFWTVNILEPHIFNSFIDPRILILLALYQTDTDNRNRLRDQITNQLLENTRSHGMPPHS